MEVSTPHVYVSALSWSSKDSFIVRRCCRSFRHSQCVTERHSANDDNHGDLRDSDLAKSIKDAYIVACSPDENRIATRPRDGSLRIFDARNGKSISEVVKGHEDEIDAICFSR